MRVNLPFVGPTYAFNNSAIGIQDTINYYVEVSGDKARTPIALRGSPGLVSFTTGLDGPVDSLYFFNGALYATAGGSFYTVTSAGSAVNRGFVGSGTRHLMSFNGTQVTITDGVSGYVYTPSVASLAKITDIDFRAAAYNVFQDTYTLFNEAGTGRLFISATGNSSSFDSLEFATAETSPDNILALLSVYRQIAVFGESTIEFWYDSANLDFPYERQEGAIIERGLGAQYSVAKDNNSFFWLGDDLIVYRANGYSAIPISTTSINETIAGYTTTNDAIGFMYTWNGHKFYTLTFPTEGVTWEFDSTVPIDYAWHKRESFDLGRWRANCATKDGNDQGSLAFGKNLVGDSQTGTIWYMDQDTFTEGTDILKATRITNYTHSDQRAVFMSELEILMESGVGIISGQGSDPQVMIRTTRDGYGVMRGERRIKLGRMGKFRKVYARGWGKFKSKAFELTITDPVNRDIIGAVGTLKIGR